MKLLLLFALLLSAFSSSLIPQVDSQHQPISNAPKETLVGNKNSSKEMYCLADTNFEDGSLGSWYDESNSKNTYWAVEDFTSPFEEKQPAPKPIQGTRYLRAKRDEDDPEGSQLFLTSESFTASPGATVSFKYWIRSRWTQTNWLQVYIVLQV